MALKTQVSHSVSHGGGREVEYNGTMREVAGAKKKKSSCCDSQVRNPTSILKDAGFIGL